MLFLAALASVGDAAAEIVSADTLPIPEAVETEATEATEGSVEAGGAPALSRPAPPFFTIAVPQEPPIEAQWHRLDRHVQTFLQELHLVDRDTGLDAYMAELRAEALGRQRSGPASAACVGPGCGRPAIGARPERTLDDQELLETLIDFRTDIRDVFTPLQTIYQDSGLKTLLEMARSDDLVFGSGRSGPESIGERGLYEAKADAPAPGRRESSAEVLALIRFIGNFWQIMRDFGIPIILLLIVVRGMFWIAKAQRARPRRDFRPSQAASGDFTPAVRPVFRTGPERRDFKGL